MAVLANPHWEDYAQARAKGMSQRKAYREAFPSSAKWKDNTVDNKASALEREHKEILARYEELKAEAATEAVLTRAEKREMLADMARNPELSARERQAAIDIDNKMEDEYKTILDGKVGVVKLEDIL